jgi:ferredoxin/coenzyme F420-reducing hydrogenase delta subunit
MTFHKSRDPELLPGANQVSDCQPDIPESERDLIEEDHDEDHDHEVTWDALEDGAAGTEQSLLNWRKKQSSWAHALERLALTVEKPVNHLIGNNRLNPFYHTGPIAIFLLMVVTGTGIYLFLFFHYGFDASYEAVTQFNGQFIARTTRAVHRYASGALVITTLLHAFRTLFMERFRGSRWLAWVTGIVLTAVIWLAGVTGYWMVWDVRAQLINESFINFLQRFTPWAAAYVAKLTEIELSGDSWPVLLIILAVHVLLTLIAAGFFWLHVRRLKRAKWFPETHWITGIAILLILAAIVFPLAILPQANPDQLPQGVHLDPIFLFFIPTADQQTAVFLWSVLIGVTILAVLLPWITKDKSANPQAKTTDIPVVNIIKERCTGCTKCALDCPYGAIVMVERHDDKPHKFIAIEDPKLCVSCGICVGSCDGVAVTMGDVPPSILWDEVSLQLTMAKAKAPEQPIKLVFTCDRHAAHGAKSYLPQEKGGSNAAVAEMDMALEVVALPCVGTLPPDLLVRSLEAGADDIQVIGCPPDDCSNREGNLWEAQRLTRQRVPRLKKAYANSPITAVWQPPNQFAEALRISPVIKLNEVGEPEPDYVLSRRLRQRLTWRNYIAAFGLLAVVLVAQIFLTDIFAKTKATEIPRVQVILPAAPGEENASAFTVPPHFDQLVVELDGVILQQEPLTAAKPIFIETLTSPGTHHVRIYLTAKNLSSSIILADEQMDFEAGNILRVKRPLAYLAK